MSSLSRTRHKGGFTSLHAEQWITRSADGAVQSNGTSSESVGTQQSMTDWVTKPFVAGRTIVNTEMNSVQTTRSAKPMSGVSRLTQYPGYYGWDGAYGTIFRDVSSYLDHVEQLSASNIDTDALVSLAATSALSSVRRPELSGLVSLVEIRETVQSLLNPVNGALRWLSRNAPTKRKRPRRTKKSVRWELRQSAKDLADQHLTVVFGIMPFISDIQGILKALEAVEPVPVRLTARGSASNFDVTSEIGESVVQNDGNNSTKLFTQSEARLTVTARAYQLYEASVTLQQALGLSLSEVPRAGWQVVPLSFVADWFANVSQYIAALTPQVGVSYITSGVTITTVKSTSCNYSEVGTHSGTYGWSSEYYGGNTTRVVVTKQRVPRSLFSLVGLHLKQNMHQEVLDTFKITAGLSLITQKLTKLL